MVLELHRHHKSHLPLPSAIHFVYTSIDLLYKAKTPLHSVLKLLFSDILLTLKVALQIGPKVLSYTLMIFDIQFHNMHFHTVHHLKKYCFQKQFGISKIMLLIHVHH